MTRDEAISIACTAAKAKPQSYYAEPFQPHEWVIDAIMAVGADVESLHIDREQLGEVLAKTNAALNRAGCYSVLYYWEHIDAIATERDSLRTSLASVEKLCEEAIGELTAASRWIDSTQYRVDDETHKQFAKHIEQAAREFRAALSKKETL